MVEETLLPVKTLWQLKSLWRTFYAKSPFLSGNPIEFIGQPLLPKLLSHYRGLIIESFPWCWEKGNGSSCIFGRYPIGIYS
jgi:hypothetical protein